ncbi:MAG TPA: hypothetical protein VMA34_01885 [Terracidiphilus sp.]|nr:hypothetical protein [Terracidiphilus sp.]
MSDSGSLLVFNGIDGSTGGYYTPPMPAADFRQLLLGSGPRTPDDKAHLADLQLRLSRDTQAHFGPEEGIDPNKLSNAGWGVVFAPGADPALQEALAPLLKLRKSQAGDRYKEYAGADAPQPGETKNAFLSRHGAGPGPVVPTAIPYYLLIVAPPDAIPFRFQYELDVEYAVGRIWFNTPAEYAAYAQTVAAAETGSLALERRAAIFATANPNDAATQLSHNLLATPLAQWARSQPNWTIDKYLGGDASKAKLTEILHSDAPAFLFTASHGLGYPSGHPAQLANQGALICQDWPGPASKEPFSDSFFFCGDDLAADARVFGTIAMHFACFGAGTPQRSDFSTDGPPPALAPAGFLARLPQRLIAHPRGGALAVIGHVERAWQYSFDWDQAGSQIAVFTSTIRRLIEGHPIGSALEPLNHRYSELSADLSGMLQDVKLGANVDPYLVAGTWTATNDARNYAVVGDPAVRLALAGDGRGASRPALGNRAPEIPATELRTMTVTIAEPAAQPSTTSSVTASSAIATAAPPMTFPAAPPALAADYSIFGDAASSLKDAVQNIGAWLAKTFDTVTCVRVSTYTSDDMTQVQIQNGAITGARLRAMTVASLDGNTQVCVPETGGQVDDALWKIHSDTLEKALISRTELLKAAAAAMASLIPGAKLP